MKCSMKCASIRITEDGKKIVAVVTFSMVDGGDALAGSVTLKTEKVEAFKVGECYTMALEA